jgi:DNA-binding CsgD family transcriptional regulator/biotin operon repressor
MRDVDDVAIRIYRYVVAHSGCREEGVAQALGISAVIAQGHLSQLRSAGLLVIGVAGDIRALPTGPDIVFEQLKAGVEFEYVQRKQELAELHGRLTRIFSEGLDGATGTPPAPVDVLPTPEAVYVHVLDFIRRARREVLHMWTGLRGSFGGWQEIADLHDGAVQRGVEVRMVYPSQMTTEILPISTMPVRVVPAPPLEMHVFDRRVGIIDDQDAVFLMIRGQALVHVLHAFFETWWNAAEDTGDFPSAEEVDLPSSEERTLLQLLCAGVKDEKIARMLGFSVRTVRRKIANLMDSLDASSRFQAGVLAARRGWL